MMLRIPVLLLLAVLALPVQAAPRGGTTLFKAARIIVAPGQEIEGGGILVTDGKIVAIGRDLPVPEGAAVVDLGRGVVFPGLVDANLLLSVDPVALEDSREVTPEWKIADGLAPGSRDLRRALLSGVTVAFVGPGNQNVIGGLAAVVKTAGDEPAERFLDPEAALKASFQSASYVNNYPPRGMAPVNQYARRPTTRMGVSWEFRKAFLDAKAHAADRSAARNEGLEILGRALGKSLGVRIAASRAMDLEAAGRLVEEFGLKVVFEEAEESFKELELLKRLGASVALRPVFRPHVASSQDGSEIRYGTFSALAGAGIPTALLSGGNGAGESLLHVAAFAVKYGATREQALAAVTIVPARILGVDRRVGTLEKGKDADFIVLSGDPLDPTSKLLGVYVDGRDRTGRKEY